MNRACINKGIVSKIGPSDRVLLLIYRNGGYMYVTIRQTGDKK